MHFTDYSFDKLPFSNLFKQYVRNFSEVSEFFETSPFDKNAIAQKADRFKFSGDRKKTATFLTDLNQKFDADEAALQNIKRLQNEEALAVVTGQQLGVYGGPLYTVFKTLSTIHVARRVEKQLGRPVIPVFWLADEDHDYDEVRTLSVLHQDEGEVESFSLPAKNNHLPTVSEIALPEELRQMRDHLKEALFNTDFSDDLWKLLDETFEPENTFLKAFGLFISRLFSKHGLILAGSNHFKVKSITGDYLKQSIVNANDIRHALEKQSQKIEYDYHRQVKLYDSNLFYLDEETGRTKISRNDEGWHTDGNIQWETSQLIEEIETYPERFSPNVFLRPILQDVLLPTIGYVAGPGETAYYGQMKEMYACFDLEMPVIFPRLSATIVEPAINRIMQELPFDFDEYGNRIEDLESDYVDRTEQQDIEAIFGEWGKKVEELTNHHKNQIAAIDPTLEAAAEKATSVFKNELDKLKGKVYRSIKQQDETQLKRIRRIKTNLFPDGNLQERILAGIFYMNKYGLDIWDKVLKSLDEDEKFNHHKLINL